MPAKAMLCFLCDARRGDEEENRKADKGRFVVRRICKLAAPPVGKCQIYIENKNPDILHYRLPAVRLAAPETSAGSRRNFILVY